MISGRDKKGGCNGRFGGNGDGEEEGMGED